MSGSVLVSASWLAEQNTASLVIADCRYNLMSPSQAADDYQAGHIPGAFFLDLEKDLCAPLSRHGGRHPLPDAIQFANVLSKIGMGPGKTLIAYDTDGSGAAHLWWLSRYYGIDQVKVLQGGFTDWQAMGLPVSTGTPSFLHTPRMLLEAQPQWKATRDAVLAREGNRALIDSRAYERFTGAREPIDPIAGRIPGAVHYDWVDVYDAPGRYRTPEDLRRHFSGLVTELAPIVYCGSGVSACSNVLALYLIDFPAILYAGSYSDWISYKSPVATGDV